MKKTFINQPLFRIIAPIIYTNIVYVMVLLFFDRVGQLAENFEFYEWIVILIFTFAQFEGLRLLNKWIEQFSATGISIRTRITLQLFTGAILSIAVISSLVSAYFYYLVKYSSFGPELLIFNAIFVVTSIYYNLLYFSVYYRTQQNKSAIEQEESLRKSVEFKLQTFKNEVNPDLLYESLESILLQLYQSPDQADAYLNHLSDVYRYMLDNRHDELTSLYNEVQASHNLLKLLNVKYGGHVHFSMEVDNNEDWQKEMVPGTLPKLLAYFVKVSLISAQQPLHITCYLDSDKELVLQAPLHERLKPLSKQAKELEEIQRAYSFFSNEPIVKVKAYGEMVIRVPLITSDIPALEME